MLILGGGIIGLEMGTVYSTLGARPTAKNSPLKKQAWP
jgi:pyruvate/2-oxoglutarate dehydrogenase complex dihydrolipoamide dehydrogenase (E3) component